MSASAESPSKPASPSQARLKLALAWLFGLALLAWLLARTPLAPVLEAIERPSAATWAITLGGLMASYGLRSGRLQVVLNLEDRRDGQQRPRRWLGLRLDALKVILMHNAAVNLLPMRAGELSFPWLAARELNLPVSRAVACLMWMRLQDLAVLAALGLALWPGLALPLRLLGLAGLVLGWHAAWWGLNKVLRKPSWHHVTSTPVSRWRGLVLKLREAMLERSHHRPAAWLLTLGNWSLKLAAGATLLSAISQTAWPVAWAGALGGELAAIFPLQGPAGFGTYEAGVWAGMATVLERHSPALSHAVGAALALHLCFLLCALGAAALAPWLPGGTSRAGAPTPQEGFPPRHPG